MKIFKFVKKAFKSNTVANVLTILASLFAIVGISIVSTVGPVYYNSTTHIRNTQEKIIQTINVCESKEYIDDTLGTPKICTAIEIPLQNNLTEQGQKAVYANKFYTLIGYYRQDNSLFGYIIIQKDKKFNPILYRKNHIFSNTMESTLPYYKKIIFCNIYASRNDTSAYYLSLSHHSLSTFDCFVGSGVSDLGYLENKYFFTRCSYDDVFHPTLSMWYRKYAHLRTDTQQFPHILYADEQLLGYLSKNQTAPFKTMDRNRANTFANFINDENINMLSFFENQFNNKLALTYSEYAYFNDNMN